MTFQTGANLYTQGFGSRPENVEIPHIENRAPTAADSNFPIGKPWVNPAANETYVLTSLIIQQGVPTATWVGSGGGSTSISQITTDSGTALPIGGDINVIGDGATIQTSSVLNNVIIGFPPDIEVNFNLNTAASNANNTHIGNATGTGQFNIDVPVGGFNVIEAGNPINIGVTANASKITIGNFSVANNGYLTLAAGNQGLQLYGTQQLNNRAIIQSDLVSAVDSVIFCDVLANAITLQLPATPVVGATYYIVHTAGDVGTNSLFIDGNGHSIFNNNAITSFIQVTVNYTAYQFIYAGNGWFFI
jgi:hypothetical protein